MRVFHGLSERDCLEMIDFYTTGYRPSGKQRAYWRRQLRRVRRNIARLGVSYIT